MVIMVSFVSSCTKETKYLPLNSDSQVALIKEHDSLYYVQIKSNTLTDRWELPYPVYQFMTRDVNADGNEDILVGVVKKNRFDSVIGKRLFIFKNYEGYVRQIEKH